MGPVVMTGNLCTQADTCLDGVCSGSPKFCEDDGNPCTNAGECDSTSGECVYEDVPNPTECDDGSACSINDSCLDGACIGEDVVCDDQNPCTSDECQPEMGCIHEIVEGSCDDGDPCTEGDQCTEGSCVSGPLKACDDENPCTDEVCDSQTGDCVVAQHSEL